MLQLKIECHRDEVEHLSDFLEQTAPLSITYTDKFDDPIFEPEIGTTPLWNDVIVHALYAGQTEIDKVQNDLNTSFPQFITTIEPVAEQDWERAWMDSFTPLQFGSRLWICPSWMTPPDPDACNLILDPGLAFGTGTHPTTSLCLTWLDKTELTGKTLIDYGCGSGVLALAAIKLGASHAYAVDLDEQALTATQNNADRNHITSEHLTIGLPDSLEAQADFIIANILLSPLLSLKNRFHQLLKSGGTLVASGILHDQPDELISAYQDLFSHVSTEIEGEWALVEFKAR